MMMIIIIIIAAILDVGWVLYAQILIESEFFLVAETNSLI